MKKCSRCGEEKSLDLFPVRMASQDGLGYKCKACAAADASVWRASNRERHRAYSRRWEIENRDRANERARQWRAKNKERRAATCRSWNERNQAKRAEQVARRRAKIVTPAWASKSAIAAFYKEAKRLEKETGVKHHVDHIVPLNSDLVCGLHVEHNLQVIPASVNVLKRNLSWPDKP
jgi:hypothetical protein